MTKLGLWIALAACALPTIAGAQRPLPATLERAASDLFLGELRRLAPEPGTDWDLRIDRVEGLSRSARSELRRSLRREFGAALSATSKVHRSRASIDSIWVRGDSAGVVLRWVSHSYCLDTPAKFDWQGGVFQTLHLLVRQDGRWTHAGSRVVMHGDSVCLEPPRTPPPVSPAVHAPDIVPDSAAHMSMRSRVVAHRFRA